MLWRCREEGRKSDRTDTGETFEPEFQRVEFWQVEEQGRKESTVWMDLSGEKAQSGPGKGKRLSSV